MTLKAVPPTADGRRDDERMVPSREATAADTSVQMPVDIRSVSLTVLAAIAVVLMLQYAQATNRIGGSTSSATSRQFCRSWSV